GSWRVERTEEVTAAPTRASVESRPARPVANGRTGLDHPQLVSWGIVTLALLVYLLAAADRTQGADASPYLELSSAVHPPGLGDYADRLRGYAFPLLLAYVRSLVSPLGLGTAAQVRLVSLMALPLTTCVVAPTIARAVSRSVRVTVPRLLALSALF